MRTSSVLLAVLAGTSLGLAATTTTAAETTAAATTAAASTAAASSSALPSIGDDSTTTTKASSTTTKASSSGTTKASTSGASSSGTSATSSGTAAASSSSGSSTTGSALPTLAGATIPTMVIPYTAGAPFMQKSAYPEGTIFIGVGAVLAFLGACVLAWRAMVAWTINRSVKRAALASIMASDTKTKYGPGGKIYAAPHEGSSLSLDALTSSGKPLASQRQSTRKEQARDPASLFFSPTANPAAAPPMPGLSQTSNRGSTYLPAGYYASGNRDSTLGAPQATHARNSRIEQTPPSSRDGSGPRSQAPRANSALLSPGYAQNQTSSSSLAVGTGAYDDGSGVGSNLPGQRAPSAYFEDLLTEHGHGPRERY